MSIRVIKHTMYAVDVTVVKARLTAIRERIGRSLDSESASRQSALEDVDKMLADLIAEWSA